MLFKKPSIYIEVTDDTLILAIMSHTRGKYCFKNIQKKPLNKLDVINGIIFNPTALFTLIITFLEDLHHKPNRCNAILALPNLNSTHTIPPHCITLQAILCAAKTGLAIIQVIPISLSPDAATSYIKHKTLKKIPNLLQPFQNQNRPPLAWWTLGMILLLTATASYCINSIKKPQADIRAYNAQLETLCTQAEKLERADLKTEPLEKNTKETHATIIKLQNFAQSNISASPILQAITQHIPDCVMLTTLELGKTKQSQTKRIKSKKRTSLTKNKSSHIQQRSFPLIMKGLSYNADQIITFNQGLGSLKQLRNVKLTHLKRLKSKKLNSKTKKSPFHYAFTLQAIAYLSSSS